MPRATVIALIGAIVLVVAGCGPQVYRPDPEFRWQVEPVPASAELMIPPKPNEATVVHVALDARAYAVQPDLGIIKGTLALVFRQYGRDVVWDPDAKDRITIATGDGVHMLVSASIGGVETGDRNGELKRYQIADAPKFAKDSGSEGIGRSMFVVLVTTEVLNALAEKGKLP